MRLWDRIEAEGKAELVNFTTDPERWRAKEFLESVKSGEFQFWQIFYAGKLIFLIWLQDFKPCRCQIHWCVMGKVDRATVVLGHATITLLMRRYGLECMYGLAPETNERAILAARTAGFEITGNVPKSIYSYKLGRNVDSIVLTRTAEV